MPPVAPLVRLGTAVSTIAAMRTLGAAMMFATSIAIAPATPAIPMSLIAAFVTMVPMLVARSLAAGPRAQPARCQIASATGARICPGAGASAHQSTRWARATALTGAGAVGNTVGTAGASEAGFLSRVSAESGNSSSCSTIW